MNDHDYILTTSPEVCANNDVEDFEVDVNPSKISKINLSHTPIKSLSAKKKLRGNQNEEEEEANSAAILKAVMALTTKMDAQTEMLKSFEKRIEANAIATKENRQEIAMLQKKIDALHKEKREIKSACEEQARCKRRWNLRLTGLSKKDGENTREVVIGILTRVVPLSVDRLRDIVDTVHRLGKKNTAATSNNTPRAIIIQLGMRTVRDKVWK